MLLATNHNLATRDQVHPQLLPIQSVFPVKNPKIQNLVNEILNDSAIFEVNTRENSNISKAVKNPPVPTPQNLPKKLVPFVIDNENALETNENDPNLQMVNLTKR